MSMDNKFLSKEDLATLRRTYKGHDDMMQVLDHIDALERQIGALEKRNQHVFSIVEQNAIYDEKPSFINDGILMHLMNYHCHGGTVSDLADAKEAGLRNPRIFRTILRIEYEDITEKELARAAAKAAIASAQEDKG